MMPNDISIKQNQETSISMIAAFRQKYADVKRLSFVQTVLSVWLPIFLVLLALALNSQKLTASLGIAQVDIAVYVSFYCVVIALTDLIIFSKFIEDGKELAAKIQERFDTNVLGLPWNSTLVGPKPDAEVIYRLKNDFLNNKQNKRNDLVDWYNPKVESVSHDVGVLLCQRMNLYWDKSLRQIVNDRVFIALVFWSIFTLTVALNQDLSLQTLFLSVICPLLPILSYSIKLIIDNKKSISTLSRLKDMLEEAFAEASSQKLTNEKLREVQNEIYQHRKTNRPISDRFYWKLKSDYEDDAQYSIEQSIAQIGEK
jgi:ABC-type multidrug transport system fused ATPase/permease subunit